MANDDSALKKVPPAVHIFCPRLSDEDRGDHDEKQERESQERRDQFFTALPLLAFDGEECRPYHAWIYETLDTQLAKCEACIRRYHLGKIGFKAQLLQDYEDDEVKQFLDIINRRDLERIKNGLDSATKRLEPLPPQERSPKVLDNAQLFALYETLHCEAFYTSEDLLKAHFDKPFKLVQTHRELKIKEVLPAVTKFLFSQDTHRLNWAVKTWLRLDRSPTDEEWEWAIKDILVSELNAIRDDTGLVRYWSGLRVIIGKLSAEQIRLKLFDLGFNFPRMCLDHLARRTAAIPQITQSLKILWSKAPDAYWQALPSVSAATVAEQVFASPSFDKALETYAASTNMNASFDVLSWIDALLNALQPGTRPPATRTLTHQLFNRVKSAQLSEAAKQVCFEWAVKSLVTTILSFSDDEATRNSAGRPVLSDALATVSTHLPSILAFQLSRDDAGSPSVRDQVITLVRNSLALDCILLKSDYEALSISKPKAQNSSHTPELWRTVNRYLDADRHDLSMALLRSTMALAGLEQFPIKADTSCKAEKESFNTMFAKVEELLSQCIDHLAEFPAKHLDPLFTQQDTNMALMALLFSSNDSIYQATVELIKNIAQEPGRIEALAHVVDAFFSSTLYSLCWVFRRIASMMPFKPIPRLLQTGKDIMDLLCDSNGLLRTRKLEGREAHAAQAYWQYTWLILTTIFRRMEKWSIDVSDKPLMTEVCRNTMQYAQELFGHYFVFVKAVEQGTKAGEKPDVATALLNTEASSSAGSPPKALDSMVKWLRLRDPYLAETLVNLIVEMLRRLKEYGTVIPSDSYALTFVEEVAVAGASKGKGTRTILSDNQKAGLIRALEQYIGKQIVRQPKLTAKKQQRLDLDSWTDASGKAKVKPEIITLDDDDLSEGIKDEDLTDLKALLDKTELSQAEKHRREALLAQRKEQKLQQKKAAAVVKPQGLSLLEIQRKQAASSRAFIEQRKKEADAAKARQKELAARLKGRTGSEQTAQAGSGLAGLGVQGKDHIVPRSDLMVSSESESDSSEDDELFGSTKTATTTINRAGKPVSVPIKKIKQVRSAKDMRARLSPDLTGLHKTILSWDFFAETETPPNSGKDDYTLVTNTFRTVEDYQRTFEPLLVLEGWQSFRTAREDGNFKPFEVKVASSMIVDNFFEINSTISMAEGRELGIGPSDVVLLSRGSRPHAEPSEPHCLARVKEVTRKRGEVQIVYRVNSANNPMRHHLNDKATVYAVQILSLTPLEREYGALMALPYYDLAEEIIRAKPSPLLEYTDEEVLDLQELHNLNTAQAKAVKSAVDNDAFTLVQGPPGSGKTKTITAILSEVMTRMLKTHSVSARPSGGPAPPPSSKKVLVCAPSNAAVDELVMRFKDGVKMQDGKTEKLNVVRFGRSEAINAAVKDVTLEELVNARLSETTGSNENGKDNIHDVMMEHKGVSDEMLELRRKMDETRQKGEQVSSADEQLLEGFRRKKTILSSKIDQMREKQNSATRDADINRRRIQQSILDSAHVLCATLSGSGHDTFQSLNVEFETVIIDEAAQSIELSALIPLKYGCSKCILVGDPKQLPPTVLSRQAAKYQYEQSLFARMENNHRKDVHLLDIQYRMHPEISAFPSRTFYDSRLRDGADMARLRARPWHRSQVFSPYRFFDVEGMSESAPKGRSLVNNAEINVALAMYDRLVSDVTKYDFRRKIGIITPYKGQLKALKQRFSMRYGENILDAIEFNTTDAFQGREAEIIIFSCVRASTQGIGFLKDVRRMNVGLTRAKCSLWVLGNSQALVQGEFWRALVTDSRTRNLYTDGNLTQLFNKPLLTADMMKDDVEMGGMSEDSQRPQSVSTTTSRERTAAPASDSQPNSAKALSHEKDSRSNTPSLAVKNGTTRQNHPTAASERSTPSRPDPPSRQLSNSSIPAAVPESRNVKPALSVVTGTKSHGQGHANDDPQSAVKRPPAGTGVNGPSGGRFGLNARVNCNICGSDQHFSHNCDNDKAREASIGRCHRCGLAGHSKSTCAAKRCLACGEIGHAEANCGVPENKKMTPTERKEVQRQEEDHRRHVQRNRENRTRKQLGEHGASIPMVKTGSDSGAEKRKRESSTDGPSSAKAQKTTSPAPSSGPASMQPRPTGMGPAGARPGNGQPLIRRKKADQNSMFARR